MGQTNENNVESSALEISVDDTLRAYETIQTKGKREGESKPFREQISGDDYSHKNKKWIKKERVIDREKDYYFEKITDPETGDVLHYCEEPLSSHRGHGTAKFKKGY